MKFAAGFALALVLCACTASAFPAETLLQELSTGLKHAADAMHPAPVHGKEGNNTIIILVEYTVFPSKEADFVDSFKKLQETIDEQEGVKVFGLSRTIDQNAIFYLYSEWKKNGDYDKSELAPAFKKFVKESKELNVIYKVHRLSQVTSFKHPEA